MTNTCLCVVLLLNLYFVSTSNTTNSLKLVQILFRHGDRTPTETYPNDPYQHWPEGWGSLTNVGKQQMYKLGQLIREIYDDFLPKYYTPNSLYVRSTYADRCIMSAQTLLAGLLPPLSEQVWNPNLLWQPIPVRYVPREEDDTIAMKKNCPIYTEALKSAYQSPRIQKVNEENKELYEYVTTSTGGKMDNINAIEFLYNTLEIEKRRNLTLPEWITDDLLAQMRELAKMNYAIFTDTTLMQRLTGGVFLNNIISHITGKINNKNELDLALYSGHDITIITVSRTLGIEKFTLPEYGAYLVFELYENAAKDHEIELLYGKNFETSPEKLELNACPTPCSLKSFIEGYKDILPTDWESECSKF